MVKVYLMKTGRTTWEDQLRVESAVGAPLVPEAADEVESVAEQLRDRDISMIYAGDGEAESQTAKVAARKLRAKVKRRPELRELDYGLWQGLTVEEIRRRQPKLFKQWKSCPDSVRPPGGEGLEQAADRLRKALKELLKRHQKNGPVLLVVRPVVLGLLRCMFQDKDVSALWEQADEEYTWGSYEVDTQTL